MLIGFEANRFHSLRLGLTSPGPTPQQSKTLVSKVVFAAGQRCPSGKPAGREEEEKPQREWGGSREKGTRAEPELHLQKRTQTRPLVN